MKPLVEKTEISRLEYDSYVATARVAESQLQAAKDKLNGANQGRRYQEGRHAIPLRRASRRPRPASGKRKRESTAGARFACADVFFGQRPASLRRGRIWKPPSWILSYTTIVAPMDGVVTEKDCRRSGRWSSQGRDC